MSIERLEDHEREVGDEYQSYRLVGQFFPPQSKTLPNILTNAGSQRLLVNFDRPLLVIAFDTSFEPNLVLSTSQMVPLWHFGVSGSWRLHQFH